MTFLITGTDDALWSFVTHFCNLYLTLVKFVMALGNFDSLVSTSRNMNIVTCTIDGDQNLQAIEPYPISPCSSSSM